MNRTDKIVWLAMCALAAMMVTCAAGCVDEGTDAPDAGADATVDAGAPDATAPASCFDDGCCEACCNPTSSAHCCPADRSVCDWWGGWTDAGAGDPCDDTTCGL